jgi:hypothetical protein
MSLKEILFIVVYGAFCLVLSIGFARCSEKRAQEAIAKARAEAEAARSDLDIAVNENAKLTANMAKFEAVLDKAISEIEKAYKRDVERIEQIRDVDPAWLQCELPDGLRKVFAPYCDSDGTNEAAIIIADSMRASEGK